MTSHNVIDEELLICLQDVIVDRFYIALLSALEQTHSTLVPRDFPWVTAAFLSFDYSKYLQRYFDITWLVPRETATFSTHIMCAPYNHAIL